MTYVFALACLFLPPQDPAAATPAAAEILPPTTAVLIEVPAPLSLVDAILKHPIQGRFREDQALAQLYNAPQLNQAKAGLAMAEFALGMKWQDAVKTLAGAGVTFAFDPNTGGGVAVMKSGDPAKLPGLVEKLIKIANDERKKKNQRGIKSADYRGIEVHGIDKGAVAILSDAILVTTDKELGKWVLDALLDKPADTLASNATYKKCWAGKDRTDSISAFADLKLARELGVLDKLVEGTKSNVFAEFLLGGVLEALADAPFVSAGLRLDDNSIRLTARTPHDPNSVSEQREFYFGPKGTGRAPAMLSVDSTIANISTYRDVSKMWQYAGDLFNQEVNDGFAEAETNLSTLFAGKDFVEEILAEIKPGWQLVFARQNFADVLPRPAIKIPSFALVGELKDAAKMNPELKRTFQSMIGFFNVVGAMEGNPQLEQDMLVEDGVKYLTASFVPTPEDKESTEATIHFNFAPSMALGENRFVVASSLELARKAMAAAKKPIAKTNKANNFDLTVRGETLAEILGDNRGQLISNNMLEEGNSREEAEGQIDLLLKITSWFDRFSATLRPTSDELRLEFQLSLEK